MGKDAALADQLELPQALEQRTADFGALADQHQRLGALEPLRQRVGVLDVVVPDRDVVALELVEARERAHRVEIVVENRNFHAAAVRVIRSASTVVRSSASSAAISARLSDA